MTPPPAPAGPKEEERPLAPRASARPSSAAASAFLRFFLLRPSPAACELERARIASALAPDMYLPPLSGGQPEER